MLSFANDGDHDNNMHDEPSLNCDEHGSKDGWFVSQKGVLEEEREKITSASRHNECHKQITNKRHCVVLSTWC